MPLAGSVAGSRAPKRGVGEMDELDNVLEFLRRKVRDAEQASYTADMEMSDVYKSESRGQEAEGACRDAAWNVAWQGGRLSSLTMALDQIEILVKIRNNRRAAIERMEGERT